MVSSVSSESLQVDVVNSLTKDDEDKGEDVLDQPSDTILISSLPADATEESIRTAFLPYGAVVQCHMLPATPQGTAFLLQMGQLSAQWIHQNLNGTMPVGFSTPICVEACSDCDVFPWSL